MVLMAASRGLSLFCCTVAALSFASCSEHTTPPETAPPLLPTPLAPGAVLNLEPGQADTQPQFGLQARMLLQSFAIDFEGITGPVTNQFASYGVTFSGAAILIQNVSLNPPFPPHSGTNVIFNSQPTGSEGGFIQLDFAPAVTSAGAFVTGNSVITMTCYDGATVAGSESLPAANFIGAGGETPPNMFLSVSAAQITRCRFADSGNSFTLDDVTFARENEPPAFTTPSGAAFVVRAGHQVSFPVSANDPDAGQVVTLSATGVPVGASFVIPPDANPAQATFSWTPTGANAGDHVVIFKATDNFGLVATKSVTISVVGVVDVLVLVDGVPVVGWVVTAVNNVFGPFADDGVTLTMALTNASGIARLAGLRVPGNYCVHTRPLVSLLDASANNTLDVPPPNYNPGQSYNNAGAISGSPLGTAVPFNANNYAANCVTAPPIQLTNANGNATLTLPRPSGGANAQVQFLDLNGNPSGQAAWVVLDTDALSIPWAPANLGALGIKKGVLISTAPEQPSGFVNITGLPPTTSVVVESGVLNVPGQGALTTTVRLTTPGAGMSTNLGAIVLEPLLCTIARKTERTGDNSPRKIDFIGPVKDGFRANTGVPLTRRNEIAIFYGQRETGEARLHVRLNAGSREYDLNARYTWDGTVGVMEDLSGNADDAGVTARAFFAGQPDGSVRVTWAISNLPAGLRAAAYKLQTAGDQFPDAPRNDGSFSPISIPGVCTGGQGNDDKWWIGE
jgi:hypothetical protein